MLNTHDSALDAIPADQRAPFVAECEAQVRKAFADGMTFDELLKAQSRLCAAVWVAAQAAIATAYGWAPTQASVARHDDFPTAWGSATDTPIPAVGPGSDPRDIEWRICVLLAGPLAESSAVGALGISGVAERAVATALTLTLVAQTGETLADAEQRLGALVEALLDRTAAVRAKLTGLLMQQRSVDGAELAVLLRDVRRAA